MTNLTKEILHHYRDWEYLKPLPLLPAKQHEPPLQVGELFVVLNSDPKDIAQDPDGSIIMLEHDTNTDSPYFTNGENGTFYSTSNIARLPAKDYLTYAPKNTSQGPAHTKNIASSAADIRHTAIDLLKDCFADEIAHLNLRIIRDDQAPRFEKLRGSHPEIWKDFSAARGTHHETLLKGRRKRVEILTQIAEGKFTNPFTK